MSQFSLIIPTSPNTKSLQVFNALTYKHFVHTTCTVVEPFYDKYLQKYKYTMPKHFRNILVPSFIKSICLPSFLLLWFIRKGRYSYKLSPPIHCTSNLNVYAGKIEPNQTGKIPFCNARISKKELF